MNALAQSENVLATEERTSAPYHYIHIKGDMNIRIVQDEIPGVTLEGTNYQLENTVTLLRNDTLFVYQTNVRRSDNKTRLLINVENVSMLEVDGNSKVDGSGLINSDYLTIRAYNGAQIKLDVRALKVDSKVTGCSTINISGITASVSENSDECGIIDSHLLDVMDQRNNPVHFLCFGC